MSSVTRPKGPLPARVYWTRRFLVLALALGMVFGLAHLLAGRSDTPTARPVGAAAGTITQPSATAQATRSARATQPMSKAQRRRAAEATVTPTPTPTPLAVPTGPCVPHDVRVDPRVAGTAYAGRPVTFRLLLTTIESPACNWNVSPRSLVVKLTSGSDRIWSTQDCKGAIPRQPVVVRKDHVTQVIVTWRGQRSEGTCSRTTPWAQPGFYHVAAAALGAEPTDYQFELRPPRPETITPSPKPSRKAARNHDAKSTQPSGSTTD